MQWIYAALGEILERLSGQPIKPPRVHRFRPDRSIEADRRFVPMQHAPFEAAMGTLVVIVNEIKTLSRNFNIASLENLTDF